MHIAEALSSKMGHGPAWASYRSFASFALQRQLRRRNRLLREKTNLKVPISKPIPEPAQVVGHTLDVPEAHLVHTDLSGSSWVGSAQDQQCPCPSGASIGNELQGLASMQHEKYSGILKGSDGCAETKLSCRRNSAARMDILSGCGTFCGSSSEVGRQDRFTDLVDRNLITSASGEGADHALGSGCVLDLDKSSSSTHTRDRNGQDNTIKCDVPAAVSPTQSCAKSTKDTSGSNCRSNTVALRGGTSGGMRGLGLTTAAKASPIEIIGKVLSPGPSAISATLFPHLPDVSSFISLISSLPPVELHCVFVADSNL